MQTFKLTFLATALLIVTSSFVTPDVEVEEKVEWVTFEEALELNKENPKKILIDMYTSWCGWCKRMDRDTYSNETIADYINKNFYPVKFNAEQRENVVVNGTTFKFVPSGRRGYHELAANLMGGKMSYPTTVFLDENLRIISPVPGYLPASKMEVIINFISGEHYKSTQFPEYEREFQSML